MACLSSWQIRDRQQFYSHLLPSQALCFDIGANFGECTAAFLSLGARRVVAVEPQPDVAEVIAKAFPKEVRGGSLVVRTHAIGSKRGAVKMFPAQDANKSMSTLSTTFVELSRRNGQLWDEAAAFEVQVVTLDSLVEEFGVPDYIKIDVEGFDLEVLTGLSRSVPLLSFEFNTQLELREIAEQCVDCVDRLGEYEFNYQAEGSGHSSLQFARWVSAGVMRFTLRHDIARAKLFGDIFARSLVSQK
jgi:FkbM family methyltransferase